MNRALLHAVAALALLISTAAAAEDPRVEAKRKATAEAKAKARGETLDKAKEHTVEIERERALEDELMKEHVRDAGTVAAAAPVVAAPQVKLTANIVEEMELHELREAQLARLIEVTVTPGKKGRSPLATRVAAMRANENERHRLALARLKRAKDGKGPR